MVLSIILLIASIISSGLIFYFTHSYEQPWTIILYILLVPLFYLAWLGIYAIIVFIYSLFINKKKEVKKPSKGHYLVLKETLNVLLKLARVKVHISGQELIPLDTHFVLVSNHVSNFDPMVLIPLFKERLICVTKPENENIPICGPFIHKCGFIKINRESAFKAVEAINKAVKYINDDVGNIYICPEGTRSKSLELLPFHPGSFKIGVKANVPTVVCSVKNTNLIHKNFPLKRTHIYIDFLEVINTSQYDEMNTIEIAAYCENKIKENLKKYKTK